VNALRSAIAQRADRRAGRIPPPGPRRREVRSLVCIPCGPGQPESLFDTIEALVASDGDDCAVLVVDDASVDSRESVVRERFPAVEVVRNRVATGGPPALWRVCQLGIAHALERFSFEQWVKMDTDALVTAPRFSQRVLERIAAAPGVGIAGCHGIRADGVPETYRYHADVLERELGSDRTLRSAVDRAAAHGWRDGQMVHGGVLCITRAACEAMRDEGWLGWRRPWTSLTSEDFALSLFVRATGLDFLSLGGPDDGILAIANKSLPLPKEEIADGQWVAAHSVRRGLGGEDEATLRAFFRERRASWR
jgi:hypothetical protein